MVRCLSVSSRAEVTPHAAASAVCRIHSRRGCAPGSFTGRSGSAGRRILCGSTGAGIVHLMFEIGKFFLIAGPCVLEDDTLNIAIARDLNSIAAEFSIPVIYKA